MSPKTLMFMLAGTENWILQSRLSAFLRQFMRYPKTKAHRNFWQCGGLKIYDRIAFCYGIWAWFHHKKPVRRSFETNLWWNFKYHTKTLDYRNLGENIPDKALRSFFESLNNENFEYKAIIENPILNNDFKAFHKIVKNELLITNPDYKPDNSFTECCK